MKTIRTKKEIANQITGLQDFKTQISEYDLFGEHSWAKIDAQIMVLQGAKTIENELDSNLMEYVQEAEDYLAGKVDTLFDEHSVNSDF